MHRGQVFPRQVQDQAALSALAVPPGWPGAQAHLSAVGGVQHRCRTTLHQETDGHANVDDDQGDCPLGARSRARDQQSREARRLQHRRLRPGVWAEYLQQHDGGEGTRAAGAETPVRRQAEFRWSPGESMSKTQ